MAYDNTNRGSMGRNKRREKDTHPEFTGKLNVEGRDYWLSGWVREANGEKFFSLSVKPKDGASNGPKPAPSQSYGGGPVDLDDSIPFAPEWR